MKRRPTTPAALAARRACRLVRRLSRTGTGANPFDVEFIEEIGRMALHRVDWIRERDAPKWKLRRPPAPEHRL